MQGSPRIDELRQKFHENPRRYFAPLANEYRKAGDSEQAIAICRAHLAQQPGHMSGHVVYGQALYDAERIDEARTVFEKALSLDPDNPVVLRKLGDIARQRGDSTEARHWYGRALDTDPHDTEVAAYIAELTEPVSEAAVVVSAESADVSDEPIVTQDAGESDPLPAPNSPDDVEVPVPEAAQEPEVETEAAVRIDEVIPVVPPQDDVAWRNTPAHEGSPFVTRTMAELYAKQGYREAALDVYRQLAHNDPDDQEIVARIGELSADPGGEREAYVGPADHLPDIEADLLGWGDLASDAIYTPSSEELEMSDEPEVPLGVDKHFTETELPAGDAWDTDMWGAGFSIEESVPLEFDAPDTVAPAPAAEAEATPESIETPPAESVVADELIAEPEAVVDEPEEVVAELEAVVDGPEEVVDEPEAMDLSVDEEDREHFVAYSPQTPHDKDLAHYAPKGPTMREFFASLGSRRPPARTPTQSFTARAAVPSVDSLPAEEPAVPTQPGATARAHEPEIAPEPDSFSGLFPSSTVSDEDSRAAFALSGAMSGSPPGSLAPVPFRESIETAPPPPPEPGQESEEDIRRFREWLDGLAES